MPEAKPPTLTRRDWVIVALEALADHGINGVKVERIAEHINVTRGSFYWHFKSRADLLEAMLDFWRRELTEDLISRASSYATASERLRSVAADAIEHRSFGLDVHRVEEALRFWAATDEAAALKMREVDSARIDYIVRELIALGQPRQQALRRARLLYLTLIGLFTARGYNGELADDDAYAELVELVIAR